MVLTLTVNDDFRVWVVKLGCDLAKSWTLHVDVVHGAVELGVVRQHKERSSEMLTGQNSATEAVVFFCCRGDSHVISYPRSKRLY